MFSGATSSGSEALNLPVTFKVPARSVKYELVNCVLQPCAEGAPNGFLTLIKCVLNLGLCLGRMSSTHMLLRTSLVT